MQFLETFLLLGVLVTPWVSALVYQDLELEAFVVDGNTDGNLELEEGATGYYPTQSLTIGSANPHDLSARARLSKPVAEVYGIRNNNGSSRPSTKILGGRQANHGEFPYTVALMRPNQFGGLTQYCGGSLIANQWVLTAAHCLFDLTNGQPLSSKFMASMAVYAGAHNVRSPNEPHRQALKVKRAILHKYFHSKSLVNDIALLQLATPVVPGQYVKTISLSNADPVPGQNAVVSGWGSMVTNGPTSDVLKTASVSLTRNDECQQIYAHLAHQTPIRDTMMCTRVTYPKSDSCTGDSGGPLVSSGGNGMAAQIGIVSWGIKCGDYPGVYTRVNHYLDWIQRQMSRYN